MVGSSSASRCLSDIDGLPVLALHSIKCIEQSRLRLCHPSMHSSVKLLSTERMLNTCWQTPEHKSYIAG